VTPECLLTVGRSVLGTTTSATRQKCSDRCQHGLVGGRTGPAIGRGRMRRGASARCATSAGATIRRATRSPKTPSHRMVSSLPRRCRTRYDGTEHLRAQRAARRHRPGRVHAVRPLLGASDPGYRRALHDVARLNLGIVYAFCLGGWHAATRARGSAASGGGAGYNLCASTDPNRADMGYGSGAVSVRPHQSANRHELRDQRPHLCGTWHTPEQRDGSRRRLLSSARDERL
jgi:hypothetical protein